MFYDQHMNNTQHISKILKIIQKSEKCHTLVNCYTASPIN